MPRLSKEDKEKLLEKNYANIVKKLQQGKTLTKHEKELLDQAGEPEEDDRSHQGRRRVFGDKGNRCFMSMRAAAGALEISVDALRKLKEQGCDAFHGSGRVYEKPLLAWIEKYGIESGQSDQMSLKEQKVYEEVRRLRNKNGEDEQRLIDVSVVQQEITRTMTSVRSILTRRLLNEYPARVAGLSPEQARVYAKRLYDEVIEEMRTMSEPYEGTSAT